MSDDPLSASTAIELFGADALGDVRSLKRAYARMVRRYTPEAEPEAFAHIRGLYEHARAVLEAGGTLADFEAEGEDDDEASDEIPPPVLALAELLGVEREMLEQIGWTAIAYGLWNNGAEADADAIEAALLDLPEAPRASARGQWLTAIAAAQPQRAAAMWRDWQPRLADHEARARVLHLAVERLRWGLTPDEIEAELHDMQRASHPYDEETAQNVSVDLYAALAVAEAEGDVPPLVLDAIRRGHGHGPLPACEALRDLNASDLDLRRALPRIERTHPGVRAAVYQMYEDASRHRVATWYWARTGEPAEAPDAAYVTEAVEAAVAVAEREKLPRLLDRLKDAAPALGAAALIYGALRFMAGEAAGAIALGFSVGVSGWAVRWWRRRFGAGRPLAADIGPWRRMFARCGEQGIWPREVVAALWPTHHRLCEFHRVEPLLEDMPALIAGVGDGHVERLNRLAEMAWADEDDEDGEDGDADEAGTEPDAPIDAEEQT